MAVSGNDFDGEGVASSALRQAMRCLPTGVAVVSAFAPTGDPRGITVGSLVSASLVPPLILWCLGRHAVNYETFAGAESFAAHILAADQEALALHFADADRADWGDLPWREGPAGTPHLDGCQAELACRTHARHDCGDHLIIVGRVLAIEAVDAGEPLIHHGGAFRRLV